MVEVLVLLRLPTHRLAIPLLSGQLMAMFLQDQEAPHSGLHNPQALHGVMGPGKKDQVLRIVRLTFIQSISVLVCFIYHLWILFSSFIFILTQKSLVKKMPG